MPSIRKEDAMSKKKRELTFEERFYLCQMAEYSGWPFKMIADVARQSSKHREALLRLAMEYEQLELELHDWLDGSHPRSNER
jgi:hypothetical protein